MATVPVPFSRFGGLNARDDAEAVGPSEAVDLLNVSLTVPGRIATRNGSTKLNSSTPAGTWVNAVETRAGSSVHIAAFHGAGGALDKIDFAGTVTSAAATFPANFTPFQTAEFGSPSGTLLYIADTGLTGSGLTLQKWNGAVLANSSGKPQFVAVTPWDNRLAQGYYLAAADTPSAADGSTSTVFFSDAGAPDTYTSTSFVQLHPGDGEGITAMISWRDLLFVFKETAVYIFYGTSTSSTGTPVFNYRRVTLPSPITLYADGRRSSVYAAAAGPEGVYYHAADGIYITTGDTPVAISDGVRGIFTGTAPSSQTRSISGSFHYHLTAVGEQVYLSYMNTDGNARMLVFDRPSGTWVLWNAPAVAVATPVFAAGLESSTRAALPFFLDDATADLYYFNTLATTDNGTAISWSWKSGKYPLDQEQRVAIVRESSLFGTGTVTLTLSSDRYADQSGNVTLGTAPTSAEGWLQKDQEGRYFQHTLSGSGVATVEALIHNVAAVKPAGIA